MDGQEIELKLAVTPQGLERLRRLKLLRQNGKDRPVTRQLDSTYYDTAGLDLARQGITVRLRRSGEAMLQTVKTAGSRASGLFSRQEWEAPVAGEALDLRQLRATNLPAFDIADCVANFQPVFTTKVRRTLYCLSGPDWQVELALDQGEIVTAYASRPICEVELELVSGQSAHLFELAKNVVDAVPARLLAQSKSDRGFDLVAGRIPAAMKSKAVDMTADSNTIHAFQAIARNCLHHLLANEDALLTGDDPEAIHQMRVALRRLRSAMKLFKTQLAGLELEALREEMRWLLGHLGPARDTQVFMAEILAPVVDVRPGDPGMARLAEHWAQERDHALAAAIATVKDRRFTALLLRLGAWVENGDWLRNDLQPEPVAAFAARMLRKSLRRMRKAGGKDLAQLSPDHLHEVRILGKRLRYAAEFFAPLYDRKDAKHFLAVLADFQDQLGMLNDIAVARPRLAEAPHSHRTQWAAGLVMGWHEARRPVLLRDAGKSWMRLRKQTGFWEEG